MWVSLLAQTTKQPFIITISAEAPAVQTGPESYVVKSGSEVFVNVHITNTSKHNLSLGYDSDSRTGVTFEHHYEVRDSAGNSAAQRKISHPEIGSTGHGWPARILKPAESMDIPGDRISGLYNLTQPGKYTIQLLRAISGNPKDGEVRSNTITLTVTE